MAERHLVVGRGNWRMALLFVVGALVVGVGITAAFEVSRNWTVVGLLGIAALFPALIIRPARIYGLLVYFIALMVEPTGKSLDKYFVDVASYERLGYIPTSADLAIILWPSDVVLIFLVGTLFLRKLSGGQSLYFPRAAHLIVAFIIWAAFVSYLYSPLIYLSIGELFQFVRFLFIFIYAANAVDSPRVVRWLIVILLGCLLFESVITIGMYLANFTGSPLAFVYSFSGSSGYVAEFENSSGITLEDNGAFRSVGTLGNVIWLVMFLEFLLPLAFVYFWMDQRPLPKLISLAIFGLGSAAFVLTFSRMGVISLGIGLGFAFLLLLLRRRLTAIVVVPLLLLGVTGAMVAAPYAYDYMSTRPETVSNRIPLMIKSLRMIASDPIFGVGLNNHTVSKDEMFEETVRGERYSPVHNHYLAIATEVGLFGVGLQIVFFAWVLAEAVRRTRSEEFVVQLFAIAAASTFVTLYLQWFGDNFSGHVPRAMFYFFSGAVFGLRGIDRRRRARELEPRRAPASLGRGNDVRDAGPAGRAAPS